MPAIRTIRFSQGNTVTVFLPLVCLALLLGISVVAKATPRDSTKTKPPSTLNDTWYLNSDPETRYIIDTSIFDLEQYSPTQGNGVEYAYAGNFGAGAFPLVYQVNRQSGFNAGYNQFNVYAIHRDSIRYYQVVRPYTELTMMIGLKNEQFFRGRFANNHKDIISYGLEFRRIYSKGTYTNQRTNHNDFNIYAIYTSKNKHWTIQADLIFNAVKAQENGGVTNSIFDSTLFRKTLAEVQLTKAENNYRQVDFYLKAGYVAGKKYKIQVNDSTQKDALMPLFNLSYQFNVGKDWYKYRDFLPNEEFYNRFYEADSVQNDFNYLKIGNALMMEYKWRKLDSDTSYTDKNLVIYAEAGFDYQMALQNGAKNNFGNLYVAGTVRNNSASKSNIIYRAAVKYYPYGWNIHDFIVDGYAGYIFGKWGIITGQATYRLNEAPYIYERYYTDSTVNWSYNLPKTYTLAFGGKYQNPVWGIVAEANYYNVRNLPVYPGYATHYLGSGQDNFVVVHVANRNGIKGLHLDNDVYVTVPLGTGNAIADLYSMLYTKHSLFYETRVFKKALWFSTGFDVRIRYQNNPVYYDPLLGAFYPGYENQKLVPQLDWFLNLKIKTVRVFLKVDNILSAAGLKGYYSFYRYPAADLSFKFGLTWRFFE